MARQDNRGYYYKRHTKELPELHRDQAIYMHKIPWERRGILSES